MRKGRREGKIEEVHMLRLQGTEIITAVLFCECLIFLCLHVFLFIIFYFLYRLRDRSLMNVLASVSGNCPVCRMHIYRTACTCVAREMFGICDKGICFIFPCLTVGVLREGTEAEEGKSG